MFFNKYPYTDFHELNLDFLIANYKKLLDSLTELDNWVETHQKEYEALKVLYDGLVSGNFPEGMKKALYDWTVQNAASIIQSLTLMVFFGITDDGYFYADIPDSWQTIQFATTGYDITIPDTEYGQLVLSY